MISVAKATLPSTLRIDFGALGVERERERSASSLSLAPLLNSDSAWRMSSAKSATFIDTWSDGASVAAAFETCSLPASRRSA